MRILFATGSSARYMAPPRLSDEQVNCGPDWLDRSIGEYFFSLGTPTGEYDLAAIAARLPAEQQPEVVVCLVDAARRSLPRNLRAFRCPKVLLVADTHHLEAPLTQMVRYAQSEPFDRVVLLYDRHHVDFFRAAGIRQLHWFPGLTFPHSDAAVAAARREGSREARIAFVGTTGICHTRRTQLLSQLNAHALPLTVQSLGQREALDFYGSSLVGFNASLNGDLNLRIFEILASGAMLLTDELAPAAGMGELFRPGQEILTYGTPSELVERAQYAMAHPDEARSIGQAGADWFDRHFGEASRQKAFEKLVREGSDHPAFALPPARKIGTKPVDAGRQARLVAAFEYLQELHRNLDRVTLALDESVPEEFVQMCATMPRFAVQRGLPAKGQRVEFLAVGRKHFSAPELMSATHVWFWEGGEADRIALVQRSSSMGFALADSARLIFSRRRVNTHTNQGALALVRLDEGAYNDALFLAKEELAKNPKSVEALMATAEIAQETGNTSVLQAMLARLAVAAPHHPRRHQILAADPESIRSRRPKRLLRDGRTLFEQRKFEDARKLASEALGLDAKSGEAHFLSGNIAAETGNLALALDHLNVATLYSPGRSEYWFELGRVLRRQGRSSDAMAAFLAATNLDAADFEMQFALGDAALAAGHGRISVDAFTAAARIRPGHAAVPPRLEAAVALLGKTDYQTPRDLLFSHVEVTRLQGTGVLLERFFPDSSDFVTVRSRTLYQGKVDFGGVHFSLDLPGLPESARREVLRRVLAPYQFRRILCVPFFASDFMHAVAAQELTGAPLATYVMDDQVLHSKEVSPELAGRLFAVSDLRLAISPEMVAEYSAWFGCSFGLLPPIVSSLDNAVPNSWSETMGDPNRCAMVGNIWSARQFAQLRSFVRAAGLKVDWFGNANVAWLPQDKEELEADGIFRQGFLSEAQLAPRLARYPFVVIPSGALDGTEDNEWLTRLSLPSRMVFILTQTQTPMLILGSAKTAAAAFVHRFKVGTSSNYDGTEARARIGEITSSVGRARLLENARRITPAFVMPTCGDWIWSSLAAREAQPTPFADLYDDGGVPEAQRAVGILKVSTSEVPKVANASRANGGGAVAAERPAGFEAPATPAVVEARLLAIIPRLADQTFLDSQLPPDEPRQRPGEELRGAVRFVRGELAKLESNVRLLAVERLALLAPNNRAVLVAWAELLEEAGDRAEAAAKARRALSLYYDDVYTQTLFVRCVGDVNHHEHANDRFCPHPFENFEIYRDGSVFACNCTQVPFPIGNAYKQTATEIWQSPQAKAIRASILDGSFRFCSPMTCYKRFDLPKRSEHPEEFARLQRIGVDGVEPPKHLNLSYDLSCNLSCPSCRNGQIMATHEERQKLEHVRDQIVLPLLENKAAESVYITGSGDAFGSPHFRGVLKQLCDPKFAHVQITLGTNGQLITPRLWEEFQPLHSRFRDITISIDGATPETYERLRRGSTWEKLLRTMGVLEQARRSRMIRRIMVNMVVQEQNFLEMSRLIELCKGWAVDGIRFYRIRQWGNVVPGTFMASDIANPLHRRHAELMAELAKPIFSDPIVDHYDMYELIVQAKKLAQAVPVLV